MRRIILGHCQGPALKFSIMFCLLGAILLLDACVSSKKYDALVMSKDVLQKDYDQLRTVRKEKQVLSDSLIAVNTALEVTNAELADWKARYGSLYASNEETTKQLEAARAHDSDILESSSKDRDALQRQLSARMKEVDQKEKELRLMEASVKSNQGSLDEVKHYLSEREKQIKELSDALKVKDQQTALLRQKMSDVLQGYAPGELTVKQVNGKIYVSLSQGLLFAKGGDQVEQRGVDAIRKMAFALNAHPDVEINVEGHTDSDGGVDKNWTLSTARAQTVSKILIASGVAPARIIASGRGSFKPVSPNDTEANKAKNRRTEIILSPKLDELYNIIKSN